MQRSIQDSEEPWRVLRQKVTFLSRPAAYSNISIESPITTTVKVIETHMSYVFLTDRHAYKLKKPVNLPFVDFTHLPARYLNARREFHLNQELAPGVYLRVVPLLLDPQQEFRLVDAISPGALAAEWLLVMKRLPPEWMLDAAMQRPDLPLAPLEAVARRLVSFYQTTRKVRVNPDDYLDRLRTKALGNLDVLVQPTYELDRRQLALLRAGQREGLARLTPEIVMRVQQGRVIDGHGDLRPEHICLTTPPVIIDRLEVDPHVRLLDPVNELALLMIECRLLGHSELGELFLKYYKLLAPDVFSPGLSGFYQSLQATSRAKFAVWHIDDPRVADKARWRAKAERYVAMAISALEV